MYALRGTLVHKSISTYLKEGKWIEPTEHEEYARLHLYIKKTGKEILSPLKCNFLGFLNKWGHLIQIEDSEQFVYDLQLGFCGTYDSKGLYVTEQDKIRIIIDYKTSSSYPQERKDEYGMQMAAYNLAGKLNAERAMIIPLNPKNKCGFGDPIILEDIGKYENMFLQKLKEFKQLVK